MMGTWLAPAGPPLAQRQQGQPAAGAVCPAQPPFVNAAHTPAPHSFAAHTTASLVIPPNTSGNGAPAHRVATGGRLSSTREREPTQASG